MSRPLAHFTSPYLAAEAIRVTAEPPGLILLDGERQLRLDVGGDVDSARQVLEHLRDPAADEWLAISQGDAPDLSELASQLDRHGWVLESDVRNQAIWDQRVAQLADICERGTAWLDGAREQAGSPELAEELAEATATTLRHLTAPRDGASHLELPSAATNLAGEALRLSIAAWRRSSPLTVQILRAVLRGATGDGPAQPVTWDETALTVTDIDEVAKQVSGALYLMVMSTSDTWSARFSRHLPTRPVAGAGLNVLVVAEACAESLLGDLGESELLATIRDETAASRTAALIYQHQYFITVRYIEAILSFLRFRLSQPLRDTGLRYLTEEMGHEVHELATCVELGLSEREVHESAPFPFFMAYPEILGVLAARNPFAFCLAVTAAEGIPGTRKPLATTLAHSGVDAPSLAAHQAIDIELDHEMFTRRLISDVAWVPEAVARDSLRDFLFVVELSQMAWRQIATYAGPHLPTVPRPFALSPGQLTGVWW